MKPKDVMLIAGEASGDMLGAELVRELRRTLTESQGGFTRDVQPLRTALEPRFFGAGGPQMKAAGVDLVLLQFSPQLEEMERFAETVIRRGSSFAAST